MEDNTSKKSSAYNAFISMDKALSVFREYAPDCNLRQLSLFLQIASQPGLTVSEYGDRTGIPRGARLSLNIERIGFPDDLEKMKDGDSDNQGTDRGSEDARGAMKG